MGKRKGKVHPSSSASSSSSSRVDPESVLRHLPETILVTALSLPIPDRKVLAYMIAKSCINPSPLLSEHPKNKYKTTAINKRMQHVALFECGCFECYGVFWRRWGLSPNNKLIDQVIESFEEHLVQKPFPKKQNRCRRKGKGITGRFETAVSVEKPENKPEISTSTEVESDVIMQETAGNGDNEVLCVEHEEHKVGDDVMENPETEVARAQAPATKHGGLVRKFLADIVGLLKSHIWSSGNI
ncbi:hypothetical protein K2173_005470 [Erythroxylum novogranatense]|uniref:Uncharacterized protein n=1 Tax=Erythroxylum novogranatense TaxID=1862640 RepID=A0AAV8SKQ8_9ROSI|nr:hypothetical protein K2173_005470 [Erythroxylum novogranatense]